MSMVLTGISLIPGLVHSVEGLFGGKGGEQKKNAALLAVGNAINLSQAVGAKQIADPEKFHSGLSKVIDGVVDCLNASVWAKK